MVVVGHYAEVEKETHVGDTVDENIYGTLNFSDYTLIEHKVTVGQNVAIGSNVIIKKHAQIGNNVVICDGVVIAAHTVVPSGVRVCCH